MKQCKRVLLCSFPIFVLSSFFCFPLSLFSHVLPSILPFLFSDFTFSKKNYLLDSTNSCFISFHCPDISSLSSYISSLRVFFHVNHFIHLFNSVVKYLITIFTCSVVNFFENIFHPLVFFAA